MPIHGIGPIGAKVAIVGEFPHITDLNRGEPFAGGSGWELTKMLTEAGHHIAGTYMTMLLKDLNWANVPGLIAHKKKEITPSHVMFQGKMVLPALREIQGRPANRRCTRHYLDHRRRRREATPGPSDRHREARRHARPHSLGRSGYVGWSQRWPRPPA